MLGWGTQPTQPCEGKEESPPTPSHTWRSLCPQGPLLPWPAGVFPFPPGLAPGHRHAQSDACLGSISADATLIKL